MTKSKYPFIRAPLSRYRCVAEAGGETYTVESDNYSIEQIINRFDRTGELPPGNGGTPQYADVSALNKDLTELHQEMGETLDSLKDFQESYTPETPETPNPVEPSPQSPEIENTESPS